MIFVYQCMQPHHHNVAVHMGTNVHTKMNIMETWGDKKNSGCVREGNIMETKLHKGNFDMFSVYDAAVL